MAEAIRKVCGVDATLTDFRANQEKEPRWRRCRRCFEDVLSDDAKLRTDELCERGFGVLRCYDTPHSGPFGDVYERDDWHEVVPEDCDACDAIELNGLPFPLAVENVLVEQPEIGDVSGTRIGSIVVVRPCDPAFEDKTYLGILVGEMPLHIALQYDADAKELIAYSAWSNPMIVIPSESAIVYGYESWWKAVGSEDDLKDITDDEILSQPYMVALMESIQGDLS